MKNRIRAAAIIIDNNKILLVKHVHPITGFEWWVPPGGGIEVSDNSIKDCIIRETFEETGYKINVASEPKFLREFLDIENDTLNMELFFTATIAGGNKTINNIYGNGDDEEYIKAAEWLSIKQIQSIRIYPEELKDTFGMNIKNVYLGRQQG